MSKHDEPTRPMSYEEALGFYQGRVEDDPKGVLEDLKLYQKRRGKPRDDISPDKIQMLDMADSNLRSLSDPDLGRLISDLETKFKKTE